MNNKDKDEYVLEIETVDHEIMLRNLDTAKTLKDFYIYLTKMQIYLLQERYIFNKIYFNEFDFLIQNKIGFRILMSNFSQFDINNSLYSDIFNWMKSYFSKWQIISNNRGSLEIELSFTHCPSLQLLRGL